MITMKTTASLSLVLSFFLLFQFANAFNITEILLRYPDFSSFNAYLTKANLAGIINSHDAITVLVVDNGNLSPVSGKSPPVLTNIMSVQVLLDYFDITKLYQLPIGPFMTTSLFQTYGTSRGQQGFVSVTRLEKGRFAFVSAEAGSSARSNLVKPVFTEPYNISVLQVSNMVVPRGIYGTASPPAPGPAQSQSPAASPAPWSRTPPSRAPSQSPSMSPGASMIATPPTTSGRAPTPPESIGAAPDANADAPDAADLGPAADSGPAAAKEKGVSGAGTTLRVGLAVVWTLLVSTICNV